jgi:hypothetical protein
MKGVIPAVVGVDELPRMAPELRPFPRVGE